ncbi:hypothetical protein ABZ804_22230 [Streptomyces sp. NPDC047726]|uniref:hypothetical protein n=1 Tax=unclassified Streptomyces TaxID=2593676 RepID=UPI0033EC9A23
MADGDYRLVYASYESLPGAALTFGRVSSGIYTLKHPTITFADPEIGDQPMPGEDGVRQGRDYQRAASATLELGVDTVDAPAVRKYPPALITAPGQIIGNWPDNPLLLAQLKRTGTPESWNRDALAMLRQVWRADSLRGGPSRLGYLSRTAAGRTRRMYGRPRDFGTGSEDLTAQGYTPVVAKFTAVDDKFYDDTAKTEELWDVYQGGSPPRPGRPDWNPWPEQVSKRTAPLMVAGDLPTHTAITIYGPCTNPKVTISGLWAVQLSLTLVADEYVTINAYPWARTVTKWAANGATSSVADKLTRASPRLAKMTLVPGRLQAQLSYSPVTTLRLKGPRVKIEWRDAYAYW